MQVIQTPPKPTPLQATVLEGPARIDPFQVGTRAQTPNIPQRQQSQEPPDPRRTAALQIETTPLERLEERLDPPAPPVQRQKIRGRLIAHHDQPILLPVFGLLLSEPLSPDEDRRSPQVPGLLFVAA